MARMGCRLITAQNVCRRSANLSNANNVWNVNSSGNVNNNNANNGNYCAPDCIMKKRENLHIVKGCFDDECKEPNSPAKAQTILW